MKGDFHVRFRENVGVQFPRVTRLAASVLKDSDMTKKRVTETEK
jgi:hypothetical protein